MVAESRDYGIVRLSDGTVLKLKITIVDAREAGFSPFGGVNIVVKTVGGIGVIEIPQELHGRVADKPVMPPEPPREGWEIVDIENYEPAVEETRVNTSKGEFLVKVQAEPVMAARNLNYKTELNEPPYWLNWVLKVSWRPVGGESR